MVSRNCILVSRNCILVSKNCYLVSRNCILVRRNAIWVAVISESIQLNSQDPLEVLFQVVLWLTELRSGTARLELLKHVLVAENRNAMFVKREREALFAAHISEWM